MWRRNREVVALIAATALTSGLLGLGGGSPAHAAAYQRGNPAPLAPIDLGYRTSSLTVVGITGTVTDVNVSLNGLDTTDPDHVDAMLVGPNGQRVVLMSDVCHIGTATQETFVFDDEAAVGAPISDFCVGATVRPTDFDSGVDTYAPGAPTATTLGAFDGVTPNGTWTLVFVDDTPTGLSELEGGFALHITATDPPTPPAPRITITSKPSNPTFSRRARFAWRANVPGLRFQCRIDKRPFRRCTSPKVYRDLKPGWHTFTVKTRDALGRTASKRIGWRIKRR